MYHEGKGVTQDYAKAIEYYTLSANQNNSYGQNNLGTPAISSSNPSTPIIASTRTVRCRLESYCNSARRPSCFDPSLPLVTRSGFFFKSKSKVFDMAHLLFFFFMDIDSC